MHFEQHKAIFIVIFASTYTIADFSIEPLIKILVLQGSASFLIMI